MGFAVSAETPETQIGAYDSNTQAVSNWLPDLAAFVQYQWGADQHVRLAGILRTLSYRNVLQEKNHNKLGRALQLALSPILIKPLPHMPRQATAMVMQAFAETL